MADQRPKPAAGNSRLFLGFALFWLVSMAMVVWWMRRGPEVVVIHDKPVVEKKADSTNAEPEEAPLQPTRRRAANPPPPYVPPSARQIHQTSSDPSSSLAANTKPSPAPIGSVPVLIDTGASADGLGAGSIHGHIRLIGTPPPETPIRFDEVCGKIHPFGATTRRYVVSPNSRLANVVVYIAKGLEGQNFPLPQPMELNQQACLYEPYISAVMLGQTVRIKNSDMVLHNVHALPQADGNSEFNFGQPMVDMVDETTFTKKITRPELMVKLKCDVHDWMLAYVSVLPNPFFAVSDTNGDFTIPNVPPGTYTLIARHLHAGSKTNVVTLRAGRNVSANFSLNAPKSR